MIRIKRMVGDLAISGIYEIISRIWKVYGVFSDGASPIYVEETLANERAVLSCSLQNHGG